MNETIRVSLSNLSDGAAEELFALAFAQVLANIDDPNTPWKAKRAITLSFEFTTDEERRHAWVDIAYATKLAAAKPATTVLHLGRHKGELAASEAMRQEDMFPEPAGRPAAVAEGVSP